MARARKHGEFLDIDGAQGEGGGQVLRTSLALSLITQTPVRLRRIRAGRRKPGLLRQHLTAVRAASTIGCARVTGDELRANEIEFTPGTITHGDYRFAVGTAGSATLVFQTVLWPLVMTPGRSRITFEGGTHNPKAPPFEFIERVFVPQLRRMGVRLSASLERHGFYPAGGGRFVVEIEGGGAPKPIELLTRGPVVARRAEALWANLPKKVADREILVVRNKLGLTRPELGTREVKSQGPGNALLLELEYDECAELFAGFGAPGRQAEDVAEEVVAEAREFLDAPDVPVGRHLADQLLLPLALAGGGSFRTLSPTLHTTTNVDVIGTFLRGVPISIAQEDDGPAYRVSVGGA